MSNLATIPNFAGGRLRSVEKKDYSWFFLFTEGVSITTGTAWRFVNADHLVVTSEDHGASFGLPKPVDASVRVLSVVQETPVQSSRVDPATGDLFVYFSDRTFLQFLQMSGGYEAWRLCVGDREFICTGGGNIAIFGGKPDGR